MKAIDLEALDQALEDNHRRFMTDALLDGCDPDEVDAAVASARAAWQEQRRQLLEWASEVKRT